MEMLPTSRSFGAGQADSPLLPPNLPMLDVPAAAVIVAETDIDAVSQEHFLANNPLSLATYIIPLALIAVCSVSLPDWRVMAGLLVINVTIVLAQLGLNQAIRKAQTPLQTQRLWRAYEGLMVLSGVGWAALMQPTVETFGRNIASMFVCVIIIVTIAITAMASATQWRSFIAYLIGSMVCLFSQTILYYGIIGPVPLLATIGLVPSLIALAHMFRKQSRLMIRTQLENQCLANELTRALSTAEFLANRDSLTGLYNRRAFERVATAMQADVSTHPLSLILIDLDHFKAINDRYGHGVGDSVLRHTAELVSGMAGPNDIIGRGDGAVARWGGEEFILLLPECSTEKAEALAQLLLVGLTRLSAPDWPADLRVSGSFGVAKWSAETSLHQGIANADTAMYRAKADGRNRVCVHAVGEGSN